MKRLLLPLLAALALPTSLNAEVDFLGLPIIEGWVKKEIIGEWVSYKNPTYYNIQVRGEFGRYMLAQYIVRWWQNPSSYSMGGVRTSSYDFVIDCEDKTYRAYGNPFGINLSKRWKKIEPDTMESGIAKSCYLINSFPKGTYSKL